MDITISKFINVYERSFLNNEKAPSVMLVSEAGIGKTSVVESLAKKYGYRLYVFRGAEHDSTDLIGLPNIKDRITYNSKPFWIPKWDEKFIFFADEINRAKIDVRQSCFRIAEKRGTETWDFNPKNHKVILAINPSNEDYQTEDLDKAFLNRLAIFNIIPDVESFISWGEQNNIDQRILKFIKDNPDCLCYKPNIPLTQYPTPRSWEYLSSITNNKNNVKEIENEIYAIIGDEIGLKLIKYIDSNCEIIDVNKLIKLDKHELEKYNKTKSILTKSSIIKKLSEIVNENNISNVFSIIKDKENLMLFIKELPAKQFHSLYNNNSTFKNKIINIVTEQI